MDWVKVSDNLPDENGFYLGTIILNPLLEREVIKVYYDGRFNAFLSSRRVIAWKILPEPFDGEYEGGK